MNYIPGGPGMPVDAEYDAVETAQEISEQNVRLQKKYNGRDTGELCGLLKRLIAEKSVQTEIAKKLGKELDPRFQEIPEIEMELKRRQNGESETPKEFHPNQLKGEAFKKFRYKELGGDRTLERVFGIIDTEKDIEQLILASSRVRGRIKRLKVIVENKGLVEEAVKCVIMELLYFQKEIEHLSGLGKTMNLPEGKKTCGEIKKEMKEFFEKEKDIIDSLPEVYKDTCSSLVD